MLPKISPLFPQGTHVLGIFWGFGRSPSSGPEVRFATPGSFVATAAPRIQVKVACNGKAVAVRTLDDGSLSFPTQVGSTFMVAPR
jgi:hypothetical protein